jgi:membrane-associated phospholipid phosphatase
MTWRLALVLAVLGAARPAHADEPSDRTREIEAGVTAAMGTAYLVAEFALGSELSPTTCRWCYPDGFDAGARNLLRWRDTSLANTLSDASGYVTAPIAAAGLTIVAGRGRDWRRHYDDVVPIVQAAIAASLLQHVTKLGVARQRPYAHYTPPGTLVPSEEDNVSFWSGHASLTFALAVSAGTVTSSRGYALAPAVWATGLALAATTSYLRIAADRHYATDVLAGAAVGTIVGYAWPKLVHPWIGRDVDVVPTGNGLAAVGRF